MISKLRDYVDFAYLISISQEATERLRKKQNKIEPFF